MSDPINLRRARKDKSRAAKERVAAQNRVTFGQTKAVKSFLKAKANLTENKLDALMLDKVKPDEPN
jgi:Domain of unknown function (DUF4169)